MYLTPNPPPAIEAQALSFDYDNGSRALQNLTFSIDAGAYVGVIGPNGGGKTTLMRLILGLLSPSAGRILVNGQAPLDARAHGRIGYVPQRIAQDGAAFPATVEEIVRSGRTAVRGMFHRFTADDRSAVEEALDATGTLPFRTRQIGSLSGGERQRTFIARALAARPSLLVLDEPMTGVDPAARESFTALLRSLNRERGITIVFVSHDLEVTMAETTSLLCINRTLVCDCGTRERLSPAVIEELYGRDATLLHHTH